MPSLSFSHHRQFVQSMLLLCKKEWCAHVMHTRFRKYVISARFDTSIFHMTFPSFYSVFIILTLIPSLFVVFVFCSLLAWLSIQLVGDNEKYRNSNNNHKTYKETKKKDNTRNVQLEAKQSNNIRIHIFSDKSWSFLRDFSSLSQGFCMSHSDFIFHFRKIFFGRTPFAIYIWYFRMQNNAILYSSLFFCCVRDFFYQYFGWMVELLLPLWNQHDSIQSLNF